MKPESDLKLVQMSEVMQQEVNWLWKDYAQNFIRLPRQYLDWV